MARDTFVEAAQDGPGPKRMSRPRLWRRVRFKLFIISLTLLGIPWAAYRFVQETEHFLRDAQDQALRTTAGLVANVMHEHDDAFNGIAQPGSVLTFRNLFLHELREAPQLDGYRDDWTRYQHNFTHLQSIDERLDARILLGRYGRYVYLLLAVRDPDTRYGDQGDAVDLALTDNKGRLQRYRFQPRAPGWVAARSLPTATPSAESSNMPAINPAIRGEWQNADDGYTLELRLPRHLLNDRLSVRLFDSNGGRVLASGPMAPTEALGRVVRRSTRLSRALAPLVPTAARVWVTDHQGLVLASAGQLDADAPQNPNSSGMPWFVRDLLLAILTDESDTVSALHSDQTQLFVHPVVDALAGRPRSLRRKPPTGNAVVVGAAVPIRSSRGIRGAVLVEQTTSAVLSAENLALQRLFGVTLLFFAVTGLGLLGFASLLASRISQLRSQVENSLVGEARLEASAEDRTGDEIDALRFRFADLLSRLRGQDREPIMLAASLADELNKPIAALRRSVDADDATPDSPSSQITQMREQMREQVRQVESTLARLREIQDLQRSHHQAAHQMFDLAALLQHQVVGLGETHENVEILLRGTEHPIPLHGIPELIGQAITVLVERLVGLRKPGGGVRIDCHVRPDRVDIEVSGDGPLPTELVGGIGPPGYGGTPSPIEVWLGLDLYLVQLIGALHGGSAEAAVRREPLGLVLVLSLRRIDGECLGKL